MCVCVCLCRTVGVSRARRDPRPGRGRKAPIETKIHATTRRANGRTREPRYGKGRGEGQPRVRGARRGARGASARPRARGVRPVARASEASARGTRDVDGRYQILTIKLTKRRFPHSLRRERDARGVGRAAPRDAASRRADTHLEGRELLRLGCSCGARETVRVAVSQFRETTRGKTNQRTSCQVAHFPVFVFASWLASGNNRIRRYQECTELSPRRRRAGAAVSHGEQR